MHTYEVRPRKDHRSVDLISLPKCRVVRHDSTMKPLLSGSPNARIFVSYAREDQVPAGALVSFLRAAGFDIWFDKDSLYAGQDWRTVIEQEIAHARLLVICFSRSSVDKTGFVQKEMRLALQQTELRPSSRVYIIPVSLGWLCGASSLQRLHVLDVGAPDASRRLLEAIGNATGDGARALRDAHDALTAAISGYRRQLSGLGEVVQLKDYSKRILGRWLGARKYVAFYTDGRWGVQRNEESPIEINGRRWRIEGNKLLLTWRGEAGLETTENTITSFMTNQFVTEADGHNETYDGRLSKLRGIRACQRSGWCEEHVTARLK